MNRTFLTLIAILLLQAGSAHAQPQAMGMEEMIRTVRKGVVKVQGIDLGGPTSAGWGGGSGFLFEIDYDTRTGYVLTNHHVSGASSISAVTFWNGDSYKARLVGTEPGIDVALLEVYDLPDERDLPDDEKTIFPVVLGDSDAVRIGELGVAMGAPGDFNDAVNIDRSNPYDAGMLMQTASNGEVSGRDWPIEFLLGINRQAQASLGRQYGTNFDYAFKVSVPINPGNSGGPLFNNRGEVIGINFWGGSFQMAQNSNHAIPINLAKDFAFQLLEKGRFEKPWLGMDIIFPNWVSVDEYTEFTEKYRPDYIEVYDIRRNSPAARAGLKKGDIIVSVDGQEFTDSEQLRLYVFSQAIGNELEFVIKRDDRILKEPIFIEVGVKRTYDSEFSV